MTKSEIRLAARCLRRAKMHKAKSVETPARISGRDVAIFLTPAEVETLTDYRRPSMQCKHLDRIGVPYFPNRSGKPIVLRSDLEQRRMPPNGPATHQRLRVAASSV